METKLQVELQQYIAQMEERQRQQQSQWTLERNSHMELNRKWTLERNSQMKLSRNAHELNEKLTEKFRSTLDDGQHGHTMSEDFKTRMLEAEQRAEQESPGFQAEG